jgi:hypothetical protein
VADPNTKTMPRAKSAANATRERDSSPVSPGVRGSIRASLSAFAPQGALASRIDAAIKFLGGGSQLQRKLLIASGIVASLVLVSYVFGLPEWMKQRRENRQWVVVNKLTPESLIRRCGAPLSDETKDLYPVITRDVSYSARPSGTVVLKFSRTAEEQSDWVFMAMQDAATGAPYDTPVAKITALSCLDSSK